MAASSCRKRSYCGDDDDDGDDDNDDDLQQENEIGRFLGGEQLTCVSSFGILNRLLSVCQSVDGSVSSLFVWEDS